MSDWYKDAIIYQLHVRAFRDSDGSGTGDFRGLLEKLDYIQELGVNCLWLMPFYPSPLKDDGLDDFQEFLDETHRRGMRVITDGPGTPRQTPTTGTGSSATSPT